MTPLAAALKYREMGLSVIPVRPDKKPHLKWTEFQERLASEEEIESWWERWPSAMVGIVTGQLSGLVVVDADSEQAWKELQELLPESFVTCIAKTPRGYHLYLIMPTQIIGNATGILPGIDIRGEGGYVIAPPSVNGSGAEYNWLEDVAIFDVAPAKPPIDLYNSLFMHLGGNSNKATNTTKTTETTEYFTEGRRDEDIFSAANALVKGGCQLPFTEQVIDILAKNCKPPFPQEEIQAKIDSARKRSERRNRNIAAEVKEFAVTTTGHFETTSCHRELQLTHRDEMKAANMALSRLCEGSDPVLEKHGARRGCYRRIDRTVEFMDFASADIENTVDLCLPLDMHVKTKIYPKGAVVFAGVSGMGKTLFVLNAIAMNRGKYPIFYFNSEMGPEALKKKLSHFPISIDEWARSMKVVDNWDFYNIADKIQPDAFNVIDYLEPEGEKSFNIHGVISAIIRRLNKGTALIAVQKKPGATLGTGGIYSIKAATLALAIDWGKIEIVKNRFREGDPNPDRGKVNFEVTNGHQIVQKGPWYR